MEKGDICINQIRALKLPDSERETRCVLCSDYESCPSYVPVSCTQEPFRYGKNAYVISRIEEIVHGK